MIDWENEFWLATVRADKLAKDCRALKYNLRRFQEKYDKVNKLLVESAKANARWRVNFQELADQKNHYQARAELAEAKPAKKKKK